jgi:transcriptional regulator with XRE-family HTH domain
MQIGAKLRELRTSRRRTLAQVSQGTGLSASFLGDMERGRTRPSVESIKTLAAYYGVSPNELLVDVDIESGVPSPPGFDDFVASTPVDSSLLGILVQVEQEAQRRAHTVEEWRELYYSLKRLLGR